MSDEDKKNGEEAPKVRASMLIVWALDGRIEVKGPLNDKGTCYLMLECAKDVVRDHSARQEGARLIETAPASLLRAVPK